jgi:PKD repeat protein
MSIINLFSKMLKAKSKVILSTVFGLFFLTVAFQNCSKVKFQLSTMNSADLKPAGFSCEENAGSLSERTLSLSGPQALRINEAGAFSITNLDGCENINSVIWSAGDGTPSIESRDLKFNHQYNYPGIYVLRADVIDFSGVVHSEYLQVAVSDSDCSSPLPENNAVCSINLKQLNVMGPSVGWPNQMYEFAVITPNAEKLDQIEWDFRDSTPIEYGANSQSHKFGAAGKYEILIKTSGSYSNSQPLKHIIVIQEPADVNINVDSLCSVQAAELSSQTKAFINQKVPMYVNLPSCLIDRTASIKWDFGDSQSVVGDQATNHTYTKKGWYLISVDLNDKDGNVFLTLTRNIEIVEGQPDIYVDEEEQTVDRLCSKEALTSTIYGDLYTKKENCGIANLGYRNDTYRDKHTRVCTEVNGGLVWQSTTSSELVQQGQCLGQPCAVPPEAENECQKFAVSDSSIVVVSNKCYIVDNGSKPFFSEQMPKVMCDDVHQPRTCHNGILDNSVGACKGPNCTGTISYPYMDCRSGCVDFGQDGLISRNVLISSQTISVPKVCEYGETNIFDIYEKIVDQTCHSGAVIDSNTRKGKLLKEGLCPKYNWYETGVSSCSANCGGTQTVQHACKNVDTGEVVDNRYCAKIALSPVTRICDANPTLIDTRVHINNEENGSSNACPTNQIGIIIGTRSNTVTEKYACVNHKYVMASSSQSLGAWSYTNYCKNFVTVRCSHDNLSHTDAAGRYAWMQKCRKIVPNIDTFLNRFETVSFTGKDAYGIQQVNTTLTSGRPMYPTFIDPVNNKPWIAPKSVSGSCVVPQNIAVGAVCVSSCSTPEQDILAEINAKPKKLTFLDSLTQNKKSVYVVNAEGGMRKPTLKSIDVEKWITELFESEHDILVFKMKSGSELKLTPNHPVLTEKGTMKLASEFVVGNKFVKVNGQNDSIVAIRKIKFTGKVYNLFVKSSEPGDNIVVTNGYLNGTAFFQNEGSEYMNKTIIRTHLSKDAIK